MSAGIPPKVRSAIANQTVAAERRDDTALIEASQEMARVAWREPHRGVPVRSAELYDRLIGSLILAGRGDTAAAALRSAASRWTPEGERPLSRIPEAEWRVDELPLLRELRLLQRDWRPLPGLPRRPDIRALGSAQRRELRQTHALCEAMASRNGPATAKAISSIARGERAAFSILAYALYREAKRAGIVIKVPKKYAF